MPERKLSFSPISVSDSNFNPRNTISIPVVKIFVFLDLNEKSYFSLGHYLIGEMGSFSSNSLNISGMDDFFLKRVLFEWLRVR